MGWETAVLIGLNAVSAISGANTAKKEAKAAVAEGNIVASNKALDVKRKAASAKVSFLNSGLTLEGTPENAIQGIFDAGIADIAQSNSNYNNKSKNIISKARTDSLKTLAGSFASASFGDMFGGADVAGDFDSMGREVIIPYGGG